MHEKQKIWSHDFGFPSSHVLLRLQLVRDARQTGHVRLSLAVAAQSPLDAALAMNEPTKK